MNIHANHILWTLWLQMDGRRKICFDIINQEFSPQLMITFVQCFGVTEEERIPRGERFLAHIADTLLIIPAEPGSPNGKARSLWGTTYSATTGNIRDLAGLGGMER